MAAIHTAAGAAIHISTTGRRPRIRSAHLPDPAFRHGYVGSTRADWLSTCAILSTPTPPPTPTLDLHDLVRITDLSPAPKHSSTLRVAYKGSEAAAAAKAYPDCDAVPCDQFEVAFLAVELWIADRAVVPIEDSLGGSVSRNLDLLLRHRLHIVGEVQLPHHHQWRNQKFELGWTGIDWVGLECEMTNKKKENIQKNTKKQNFGVDCSQPQPNLASSLDHHCLLALPGIHQDCLADGIQDDSGNVTRFVMLAREPVVPRTDRPFKTSIVFAHDRGGTSPLFKVLSAFAFRGISLTKIESRPHRNRNRPDVGTGKQFEYIFYLDFQASMAEPRAQNALAVIQEFTSFLRVLGSYPMDMTPWGPAATSPSSSSSSSAAD